MNGPIDAVVLAAGSSRRLAPWNKLLLVGADGRCILARTLAHVRASLVRTVHVVVGHQADRVAAAAGGAVVQCADHALGLGRSLRAGIGALAADAVAVLICLGDMPLVEPAVINALLAAWRPGAIVVPLHGGQRGNPVVWDRRYFAALSALEGDQGGRGLLALHADRIIGVETCDAVLRDADTEDAVRALPGGPWHAPDGTPI